CGEVAAAPPQAVQGPVPPAPVVMVEGPVPMAPAMPPEPIPQGPQASKALLPRPRTSFGSGAPAGPSAQIAKAPQISQQPMTSPYAVLTTQGAPPPAPPKVEPVQTAQAPPPTPTSVMQPVPPSDWRKSWDESLPAAPAVRPMPPVAGQKLFAPALAQAPPPPAPICLPRPPSSVTVGNNAKRMDPLFQPDAIVSRSVEQKMPGLRDRDTQARADTRLPLPAPPGALKSPPSSAAPLASLPGEGM